MNNPQSGSACSDDEGNGCGLFFLNKGDDGLCGKCVKLGEHEAGTPSHNSWKNANQCTKCGKVYRHMTGSVCGACLLVATGPGRNGGTSAGTGGIAPSSSQPSEHFQTAEDRQRLAIEAQEVARAHSMHARTNKSSAPAFAPGGPLSNQSRHNTSIHSPNSIMVSFECRLRTAKKGKRSLDFDYGSWCSPFDRGTPMPDVAEDAIETLNRRWAKQHGMSLLNTEVEVRLAGNHIFLPETDIGSLNEVVETYVNSPLAGHYGQAVPMKNTTKHASSAPKASALRLELFIDQVKFMERQSAANGGTDSVPGAPSQSKGTRKRSGTESIHAENGLSQKRPSYGQGYAPSRPSRLRHETTSDEASKSSSAVTLQRATAVCSHLLKVQARLSTREEDRIYAAKRLEAIGDEEGSGIPTADENSDYLEQDLIRLKTLEYYLKEFYGNVRKAGVEVQSNIVVAEAFLVRERGIPSTPSDLQLV
ncbi:hypothetical protein NMY22_g15362 [Coprinellus aureogranulatus]|nr:hypothetical protein NMY22_g15362 [Coprinellus aureogranulatus]